MQVLFMSRMCCALLAVAALSACGTSQPTKYYLLSASAPDRLQASAAGELTIGVGPVILPPYLDRREMVARTSGNELGVAIYDQWAEPLAESVTRVMEEDLGHRLATDRIIRLPVKRSLRKAVDMDYQVTIAISTFEKMPDGGVVLNARWAILDNDKNELLLRRSEFSQMPAADSYAAQAAAQSQVLGRLSEEIAAAIKGLAEKHGR